jgi:hypothetical protein
MTIQPVARGTITADGVSLEYAIASSYVAAARIAKGHVEIAIDAVEIASPLRAPRRPQIGSHVLPDIGNCTNPITTAHEAV